MSAKIGPNDRLGMTLMLAGAMHALFVLGLSFTPNEKAGATDLSMLDVTLVQTRSDKAPDKADLLAQANQVGGGDSDKPNRPSDVFSSPVPKPEEGIAPIPMEAQTPTPNLEPPIDKDVIVLRQSEQSVDTSPKADEVLDKPLPKANELIERELEMARLQASIENTKNLHARRPKRKFLNANTIETAYAAYIKAWGAKVERVGNINYPEKAREQNLQGSVIMTVSIKRDGSIEKTTIAQSSGSSILDEAAIRSVELAAPFAEFPEDPNEIWEVLDITRTYQFLPGNQMRAE
jgi:periplasmic protein TonB